MMLDPKVRAQLERHWDYSGKDEDIAHEVYAYDAVLEFPQGGERFEAVENGAGGDGYPPTGGAVA